MAPPFAHGTVPWASTRGSLAEELLQSACQHPDVDGVRLPFERPVAAPGDRACERLDGIAHPWRASASVHEERRALQRWSLLETGRAFRSDEDVVAQRVCEALQALEHRRLAHLLERGCRHLHDPGHEELHGFGAKILGC